MSEVSIPILKDADVVIARRAARDLARDAGLGIADQTRLATAVSELARNALQHGGGGLCTLRQATENGQVVIGVELEDGGPGIEDVELAMTDGYSTGLGMGAGLPGTRRLMDDLSIDSQPGHTVICASMRRRPR
ncbi:MAG: ATP-binding protein [Pseudomonadota bacterium]